MKILEWVLFSVCMFWSYAGTIGLIAWSHRLYNHSKGQTVFIFFVLGPVAWIIGIILVLWNLIGGKWIEKKVAETCERLWRWLETIG